MPKADSFYADDRWIASASDERIAVFNPATGEKIGEAPAGDAADVDQAVAAAVAALPGWAATPVGERLAHLRSLRDAIADRADELALLITRQMGTPIGFSRTAQLGLPLRTFDVTIAAMENLQEQSTNRSRIVRDPIGVVAAITPWNFPLHQIAAKIVPALAAGCTVVLKPSEVTPLDALCLADIVHSTRLPAGVINIVPGGPETGAALVAHRDIAMISFTGSTAAGRKIAARAGQDLKKVALELGGKSANILLDDVEFSSVIPKAVGQCFVNAGQTCAALTRLLVPADRLTEVEALVAKAAADWAPGNPEVATTRMGPLASNRQRDRAQGFVDRAIAAGARLVPFNATIPAVEGAWFAPTVLSDVRPEMEIAREEVFGPVIALLPYSDEDEAVRLANDSNYGLSGGVWSADLARAERVAARLKTGQVILNGAMLDMEAPFGGVKSSGIGREYGLAGLEEYFSTKAITRPA